MNILHIWYFLIIGIFCGGATVAQSIRFTDCTPHTLIGFFDKSTESCAWGDYDNDGDQDFYLTIDGKNALFRNDGSDTFTDITDQAGVGDTGHSTGTAFGDLDNDGDLDLYVVNKGTLNALYRNDGPDSTGIFRFTNITLSAGTTNTTSTIGMTFIDFDRDGLLDIYVTADGPDILYKNLGKLKFQDVSVSAGISTASDNVGVGVVATDINKDGWIDLYNGNRSGDLSNLFINQGNGTFTDIANSVGITCSGLGRAVISFDFDNDLDLDLYWTTWPGGSGEPNVLYKNLGVGSSFTDVAASTGTTDSQGWAIGANTGDVNNDGYEDFFITNEYINNTLTTPNALFINIGGTSFVDTAKSGILGTIEFDGRGVAFADYDNDGDTDFIVTAGNGHFNRLYRNDTNNGFNSVTFHLKGLQSNRSAIGARVEIMTANKTLVKEVSGGAGRGSFNSLPLEFGIGAEDSVDQVKIRWPSGITSFHGPFNPGIHHISEPECMITNHQVNDKPIQTGTYQSMGDIYSYGCVDSGSNVLFRLEGNALLDCGFTVDLGAVFQIVQDTCQVE